MRREYETHRDAVRTALELLGGNVPEQLERALERVARDAPLVRVLSPAAHAMMLLGDVRKLEVEAECAQNERLLLRRQRMDVVLHAGDTAAAARVARAQSYALDRLE